MSAVHPKRTCWPARERVSAFDPFVSVSGWQLPTNDHFRVYQMLSLTRAPELQLALGLTHTFASAD
jgi:hypothetical protein